MQVIKKLKVRFYNEVMFILSSMRIVRWNEMIISGWTIGHILP